MCYEIWLNMIKIIGHSRLLLFYFCRFNTLCVKVADYWIRTAYLRLWKSPLYILSNNHCQLIREARSKRLCGHISWNFTTSDNLNLFGQFLKVHWLCGKNLNLFLLCFVIGKMFHDVDEQTILPSRKMRRKIITKFYPCDCYPKSCFAYFLLRLDNCILDVMLLTEH